MRLYFSEPVAGVRQARVARADGSFAEFHSGNGTRQLNFRGGTTTAQPERFCLEGDRPYGTAASLGRRDVAAQKFSRPVARSIVTVLLVGDSTVATYPFEHKYQGWGQAIGNCFDDRVKIINRAKGGRSSKSFRAEGLWEAALKSPADFVLIQFGHNDNPGKGPERETDPAAGGDFRANLVRYVAEARACGIQPILVTPCTRRFYDENGVIAADEKNVPYAIATLAVGEELGCPVIDLNALTRRLFNRLGEEHSDWLQPEGDRTHFTPAGAQRIAGLVAEAWSQLVPEIRPKLHLDTAR